MRWNNNTLIALFFRAQTNAVDAQVEAAAGNACA